MFKFIQKKFLISAINFLTVIGIFFSANSVLAMPEGTLLYRTSGNNRLYGYNTHELLKIHPFEKDKIELNCGHVGIYVGKDDDGIDYVVEAVNNGVQKTPAKYFVNAGAGEKLIGARIPSNATKKQREKAVILAKKLAEKRLKYDFDFRTQKGPNSEQFICVGLTEKLYESADFNIKRDDLIYNPANYAINITPDGYDDNSVYNSETGDCFATNLEYSKISRRASMGEIIGTNCGKEYDGERYFFLPHTQFLQPSLKDVEIDIQISSDFSSSKIRGLMPASKIILSWTKNNTVSSTKLAAQKVKEAGAGTKNKIVNVWNKAIKSYQNLAQIFQPFNNAQKDLSVTLPIQKDNSYNTPLIINEENLLNKIDDAEVKVLSAMKDTKENVEVFLKPKPVVSSNKDTAVRLVEAEQQEEQIGVARVIDGDTIILTTGEKIRYIGIDTPELNRPGADDDECLAWSARIRNMQLLSVGNLKLVKDPAVDKDKYGRLLRYVYAGGVFVNAQLAREGLAETFFCKPGWKECPVTVDKNSERIIRQAVNEAEQYNRGLYSDVCEQLKKEKPKKQVIDDDFMDAEKIEPKKQVHIFFGGGGNPASETENTDDVIDDVIGVEIAPVITLFELYDLISSSTVMTSSATVGVNLKVSNSEDVNGYFLSMSSTTPEMDDEKWASSSPERFVLDDEEGKKDVYIWLKYESHSVSLKPLSGYAVITLDTYFPIITFDQAPEKFSNSTSAVFEYSADEENVDLWCKIDDEAWHTCGTSIASTTINNLSEAEHNFSVQGTDILNRISSSTYTWIVDLTAPVATITAPISEYEGTNFFVSWEGSDVASSTNSAVIASGIDKFDVQYKIGDGVWIDWITATTSTSTVFDINVGGGNMVYFRSIVYDKAGNIGLSNETETQIKSTIADSIVISEIKINGSEFIELYNPTDYDTILDGWSLKRKTDSGKEYNLLANFSDNAVILSHNYYLIIHPHNYSVVPMADAVYSGTSYCMTNDNTIILYDNDKNIVDKVGLAGTIDFESVPFALNPIANQSIERKAVSSSTAEIMQGVGGHQWLGNGYDTDDNSEDFVLRNNPEPQNSSSLKEPWNEIQNFYGGVIYEGDFSNIGSTIGKWDLFYLDRYDTSLRSSWEQHTIDNIIFEDDGEKLKLTGDNEEKLQIKYGEGKIQFKIGEKNDQKRLGIRAIYSGTKVSSSNNYVLSFDSELNLGVDRNIIFRRQDGKNYYVLALRGVWGSNFPAIILAKCKNGNCKGYYYREYLWAYYFNGVNALNNEKAHIDIEVIDDNIRVFYNNRPVIEYEEKDSGYPTSGTFGFRVWSGDDGKIDVAFDNIVVRSIE